MLTPREKANTAKELQENYRRLPFDRERVLRDLDMSEAELECVLSMRNPDPSNVWSGIIWRTCWSKRESKCIRFPDLQITLRTNGSVTRLHGEKGNPKPSQNRRGDASV